MLKNASLSNYSLAVLIYNVFVIIFGAFVRATGSGAGCGAHWPLCNGVIVPKAPAIETMIEFTHRVTSGITLPLVIILVVWTWRVFPKGNEARLWSTLAVVFTVTEALIGAGLVLFGLVGNNDSMPRAFSMMAHLVNTLILLAFISLTAIWASFGSPIQKTIGKTNLVLIILSLLSMIVLAASGAVTALGDTLFPANSLREGFAQDFDAASHVLLRLRVLHPVIAIVVSLLLSWTAFKLSTIKTSLVSSRLAISQSLLCAFQLCLGVVNILLLAPVWLQLVHLLVTCLIWVNFIMVSITSLFTFNFPAGIIKHQIYHRID